MADIQTQIEIERLLFETGAINVAPEDKPFWYTSGTIGPYYSNTQNLIGGAAEAGELLKFIDSMLCTDRYLLPPMVARRVLQAYENNDCYHYIAEQIKQCVNENTDITEIDYISGGERRDWFFSYITAYMFKKPHITIYKDLEMAVSDPYADAQGGARHAQAADAADAADAAEAADAADAPDAPVCPAEGAAFAGKRCLHVSDIITEASSYARAWTAAAAKAGMRINASLTILDRMQGGSDVLASLGIRHLTLARLDGGFFDRALEHRRINDSQYSLLRRYAADPNGAMRAFLIKHPEFLRDALSAGGKEAERARMCIDSGVYGEAAAHA